jgi:hypothetical protein
MAPVVVPGSSLSEDSSLDLLVAKTSSDKGNGVSNISISGGLIGSLEAV